MVGRWTDYDAIGRTVGRTGFALYNGRGREKNK